MKKAMMDTYHRNIPSKARIMTITAAQKDGTTRALNVMAVSMEPHDTRVNGQPMELNDTI